jgi:hypothetical protein
MRKSARILGGEYGLTAQEMNFLLKEEGFLKGKPGAYNVTEKGRAYAEEQYHHRGPGGYSWYNRDWDTRTWDDGITAELDITQDRKRELRQAMAAAKQAADEQKTKVQQLSTTVTTLKDAETPRISNRNLVAGIGALVVFYGVYKAAPYVKQLWNEKAAPGLSKMKNKVVGKSEDITEETDSDGDSSISDRPSQD